MRLHEKFPFPKLVYLIVGEEGDNSSEWVSVAILELRGHCEQRRAELRGEILIGLGQVRDDRARFVLQLFARVHHLHHELRQLGRVDHLASGVERLEARVGHLGVLVQRVGHAGVHHEHEFDAFDERGGRLHEANQRQTLVVRHVVQTRALLLRQRLLVQYVLLLLLLPRTQRALQRTVAAQHLHPVFVDDADHPWRLHPRFAVNLCAI